MTKYAFNGSFEANRELTVEDILYIEQAIVNTVATEQVTKTNSTLVNINRIR